MSRLSKMIKILSGPDDIQRKKIEIHNSNDLDILRNVADIKHIWSTEYDTGYYHSRIGCNLGVDMAVIPSAIREDASGIIDNASRQIIEAIFGEFREDIYKIREALYEHNLSKASKQIDELEQKMFNV